MEVQSHGKCPIFQWKVCPELMTPWLYGWWVDDRKVLVTNWAKIGSPTLNSLNLTPRVQWFPTASCAIAMAHAGAQPKSNQLCHGSHPRWEPVLGSSKEFSNEMGLTCCINFGCYPLVMTNSSPWYRWPIEIDGSPIKNGDFPWLC